VLSGARRGRPIPPPASGRGGSSFLVAAASRRQAPGVDIISLIRRGRAPADPARAWPDHPGRVQAPGILAPEAPGRRRARLRLVHHSSTRTTDPAMVQPSRAAGERRAAEAPSGGPWWDPWPR